MLRKVVLTTGGTGGHIFPALAVAEELKERNPGVEILFLGGQYGPEGNLARKAGLKFMGLPVRGFFGRGFKAIGAGFAMLRSVFKARKIIRNFQPDVVIGFGGYAAGAGLAAAVLGKIPSMIHEQNSVPGITNRLLGRFVDRVCISLPNAESFFKDSKTLLTGNPVRKSIRDISQNTACSDKPRQETLASAHLLVLGGSQGAVAVNKAVMEDLPALLGMGLDVWLQCGNHDYERVSAQAAHYPAGRIRVDAFIEDMNNAYEWGDLAICRAGATTLAELAVAGLPSIFVPYPHATHNHQFYNAEQVQKVGAAFLIEQKNIVPGSLAGLVEKALNEPGKLQNMSCAALLLALPNAAASVAEEAWRIAAVATESKKNK